MPAETAFEYTVRTRQKTEETYTILVEKAPGHWIATVRFPDGSFWTMNTGRWWNSWNSVASSSR